MNKIVPHLWFNKEAVEAVSFYMSVFPDSRVIFKTELKNTPSGDCDIIGFRIMGFDFMAISASWPFTFNPSISFHVKCSTINQVEEIWKRLLPGGEVLMELWEYPFSKRYGWIQDKYGVSWQVIYTEDVGGQRITPVLMFTKSVYGKAEEALDFYTSVFHNAWYQIFARYEKNEAPDQEGKIKYAQLMLEGEEFGIMESAHSHNFSFNEAVSFLVNCSQQLEIDYYWNKLSAVPSSEQCGWLKDKYGVSWQVMPENMDDLMAKNPEKTTPAMLSMKKIIIDELVRAWEK